MGLAGAPRPRTSSGLPRGQGSGHPRRAPTVRRERGAGAPRGGPGLLPLVVCVESAGLGLPGWLVLRADGQPEALAGALAATLVWCGVRATRGRYALRVPDRAPGALTTPADWLLLIGVLAVLWTVVDPSIDPAAAVVALIPGLLTAAGTTWVRRLARSGRRRTARRVLVVGEAAGVDRAVRLLTSRKDHGYRVVAALPVGPAALSCEVAVPGRLAPAPAGDDASTVLGAAFAHDADLALVVPGPGFAEERLRRLSWGLHDGGLELSVVSHLSETAADRIRPSSAAGLTLLHIVPPLRRGLQPALKAAVDRAGAACGLIALSPLLLLIAVAVRLTSKGPVFHRQTRQGRHNHPFVMWKFRTMVVDAERLKARLAAANENDGPTFKMRRDPRVTRLGRLLRRSSLDELPQLINVLKGDMSLVGPRPPLPDEVSRYDERELRRLAVKPGLTGLWQVSGRSDLSWQETVSLDLWYVDNWSVATDMGLMARTLRAVTDGRGAY
ncbi:sugar transferase [Streptomyces sp. SID9124]|uniref:exopolysaccharide biosynthesis polyprenyl glycosylphosphotransferase n=1 Tax=Streptomyces sp. SID9124 TaxID=2706108 RepID=UPI0013E07894|nr:sugar transferase [Streptomyces sp. SID9124]